ncbi:MAG: sigma-70 family RNA polymerase sigma factor [Verrucomicrobiota bacterium]
MTPPAKQPPPSAPPLPPQRQQRQFEEWLRDHAAILHHTVNGFADGDDRHDLMQELLLAVWKSIPAFRQESLVSTFLYRVTHNAAMTWRRKQRTYERKIEKFRLEPPAEDPGETAPDAAKLARLYAEIRRLPPLERSLILLSLDGMSYSEMAAIHGLTGSHVGVRLSRIRQKLTQAMKGQHYE